jgi:hypothetical protein
MGIATAERQARQRCLTQASTNPARRHVTEVPSRFVALVQLWPSLPNDSTLRKDCCSNAGEFVMTQAGLRTNQDQSPVVKLTFARRMRGRDIDEKHRASTPPKLLFDLTFVVAIAGAASQLRHGLAEHHFVEAIYHP